MRILYLTHDVSDPTTAKRVRMLIAGGANVTIAGFRRAAESVTMLEGCPVVDFGRTYDARFVHRIGSVIRALCTLHRHQHLFANADVVIARNLEMLAIAVRGIKLSSHKPKLVYECLDIHRLLLRSDSIGRGLRRLEGTLAAHAHWLITSSPAFVMEYFEKQSSVRLPVMMLENKVLELGEITTSRASLTPQAPPWRIGWFGVIRCRKSLEILCALVKEHPHLVEIIIRGRIAHDQFADFDGQIRDIPNIRFLGSFTPEDLTSIYSEVHFTWAIDMFEEGLNSAWLLPNRLYASGLYGAVPLAESGVETSRFITRLGIGHTLAEPKLESLTTFLQSLTPEHYAAMKQAVLAIPREMWVHGREACVALVAGLAPQRKQVAPSHKPALVVIPCLNEAAHIEGQVNYLIIESVTQPMIIVIADGGSTDGTVEIAQRLAATHPNVHYLHNPKRIQSAAINLAIATYGNESDYLIRMDAHAHYPAGFCQTLMEEAATTSADCVSIAMNTVGKHGFQRAVAAAQNSTLGNGGSAHRLAGNEGSWVEHGHHALMRIAAFLAVGGYDERFSHNEDAELDARFTKAGYRIWLTRKTTMDYLPRATPLALFRQYRNYGRGRVRTMLIHRHRPRLRQLLPVAIVPALALLLLTPAHPIAALPFVLWAGLSLGYGVWLSYREKEPIVALSGTAAMLMHSGWSLGFWQGLWRYGRTSLPRRGRVGVGA